MARQDGATIKGKTKILMQALETVGLEIVDPDGNSVFSVADDGTVTQAGASVVGGESTGFLVTEDNAIEFRDDGISIGSGADGKLTIAADGSGTDDITLDGSVTITGLLTLAGLVSNLNLTTTARTATETGATTGTVAAGTGFVLVTSANAAHIVVLPAPTPGTILFLHVGANGYELASSAPATVAINGGADTAASSTIAAGSLVIAVCVSATAWLAIEVQDDGTVAGVEAAAA